MRFKFIAAAVGLAVANVAVADEGMWQPHQLPELESILKAKGLSIDVESISKLTEFPMNAVISLGGCTASFVSPKGLVVTNHHCAYGSIQYNSTTENNILENGFLAKTTGEEVPASPGSRVYVTEQVTDVTAKVNKGTEQLTGKARFDAIEANEKALDDYLQKEKFGAQLNNGWHVRLAFMRQWGKTSKFKIPEHKATLELASSPVVAVTIARMKPWAIPRFLRWGRPVEKLVRDHNGTLLSMASFKFPNTISTFSIWKTEKEMTNMVHGHSKMAQPKRHANAMKERERKSFHFEFVTLRFKPISEFGTWQEKDTYIPYFEMHTT